MSNVTDRIKSAVKAYMITKALWYFIVFIIVLAVVVTVIALLL